MEKNKLEYGNNLSFAVRCTLCALLLSSCTLFSPREAEQPAGGSGCTEQALTGGQVLDLFRQFLQENPECAGANLLGVGNTEFAFTFDTLDVLQSANQSKLSQWAGDDERDFYLRLEKKYRIKSFAFSSRPGYQDQPDTLFYRNYTFTRTDTSGANPVDYGGWAGIRVKQVGTKFILTSWEDHKDNVLPTFGKLRDELVE
jgi:hypothetical protein